MSRHGWIGVDLDGTLAEYEAWTGDYERIGLPVHRMLEQVKAWIANGWEVRIFSARASHLLKYELGERVSSAELAGARAAIDAIRTWCINHVGHDLKVTCVKDNHCFLMVDDRAISVDKNTGEMHASPSVQVFLEIASKPAIQD